MISSPGKVLFYGGYSILVPGHRGLSIAVKDKNGRGANAEIIEGENRLISPEFGLDGTPDPSTLVGLAYETASDYLRSFGYDRRPALKLWNSEIFGRPDEKSGLGSSAAITVSVIKTLFLANDIDPAAHIETVHKLAQWVHAKHFHKTGSGFDIATASFGRTIVYARYDPAVIKEDWRSTIQPPWKGLRAEPFEWPRAYDLLYFNLRGAAARTEQYVKVFSQWKKQRPEEFKRLMTLQNEHEAQAIAALRRADDEAVKEFTHKAREVHKEVDRQMRAINPNAKAIEPDVLTKFINKAEEIEGVVAGRCPGAGGWDGVAFIVRAGFDQWEAIKELGREMGIQMQRIELVVV